MWILAYMYGCTPLLWLVPKEARLQKKASGPLGLKLQMVVGAGNLVLWKDPSTPDRDEVSPLISISLDNPPKSHSEASLLSGSRFCDVNSESYLCPKGTHYFFDDIKQSWDMGCVEWVNRNGDWILALSTSTQALGVATFHSSCRFCG